MDDQHKHIEDWLKAAAQQPAPDDTGMEAKQQAWSKMAGLLDNAAVPVPAQEPAPLPKPWFATGQGMLWLAAAAAAVGLVALVVYLQVNRHQTSGNKELQRVVHENVSTETVNERYDTAENDTLNMNDPAAGNKDGTTVYGSTETDTMDGDNRGAALNGDTAKGINADSNGSAAGINVDAGGKGAYGPAAGTGSLVTVVVPQGNKLWSGVTAGAKKRTGEEGREAAITSGVGRGETSTDEKAVQGELSPTTNVTQPDVKKSDTALSSSNLIAEGSSSERANTNKTVPPINANNGKINNKPGNLPADKNSNLAANTPGNAVNTSKHPYVKAGKANPGGVIKRAQPSGGITGGESAGRTKPGGVTDASKVEPGAVTGTGQILREVTDAGKSKPGGVIKRAQPSGGVTGGESAGRTKPGGVTDAGKTKPGLAKTAQTGHPDNANEAQSTIIPIPTMPSHTNRQGKTPVTLKNATGTPNTLVLRPLRTVNAFSLHLPTLPLNNREQQISFLTGGFRDPVNYDDPIIGGLALQAGFVYPLSVGVAAGDSGTAKPGNGLGFKLGALYSFPIARGLYLQPTLSAAYLGGFGKAFSHTAVNRKQETDSSGAASGQYKTDSTTTPYTVKSTFVGGAGVNVAYVINKWIFSTGLTYQYALPSGAKGTPETHIHTDSLQSVPTGSTPAFSKQQLPGMHTLSWSLDAGYYIRPRIQVGVSYKAILLRSAGNSGFAKPLQPLQDKQLELYIRVPLRK